MTKRILLGMTQLYSLAGQPLHKREEEGSGVMPIRELFQRLAVMWCVQNCTREDLGQSEWYKLLNKKIWHLIGQLMRLGQPHNMGDDMEQSDWAALLAAAGTTRI